MICFETKTNEKHYKANRTLRILVIDRTSEVLIKLEFLGLFYVLWL